MQEGHNVTAEISFARAMLVVAFLLAALISGLMLFGASPHIPILVTTAFAATVAIISGQPWESVEKGTFPNGKFYLVF